MFSTVRKAGRSAASGATMVASIAGMMLLCVPVSAQINLVRVTECPKRSFPGSCTIPTTGAGNLIAVVWAAYSGYGASVVNTMTDNAGNVYARAVGSRAVNPGPNNSLDFWYAKSSLAGATTITITPSATSQGGAVIWEFSGVDTVSPLDQTAALTSQTSTSNPLGAPITTTSPIEVILSATLMSSTTGIAAGNPFVADSTMNGDGYAHLFTSSIGTYQATWNDSASGYASSAVSFKAAGSSSVNACDLSGDGAVNILDVNRVVSMTLGLTNCSANINGPETCTIVTVQRVVNASLPGGACIVDANSIVPTGLSCAPTSVTAPGSSTCTIAVSGAAPSGGAIIALSSNNPNVIVPTSATVLSGTTTVNFTSAAGSVTSDQSAVVTASANGGSQSITLSLVAPPQVSTLSCSPASLSSGQASTCTITLTKAPSSATAVTISSNVGALSVPASVTINGSTTGTFTATAGTIGSNQTATVTASLNGVSRTANISLTQTAISHSITLSWVASTSTGLSGYNVYRASTSGGPYTKINSSVVTGLSYVDTAVLAGQTYYYVGTSVNTTGVESTYSNQTQSTVPTP